MKELNLKPANWKVDLPVFPPGEVMDNSEMTEYARCPRRGFYKYGLRRGFTGSSWSIQFGLAYHKYCETVEDLMMKDDLPMSQEIHNEGVRVAIEGWENPPVEDRKSYLNIGRLYDVLMRTKARIEQEKKNDSIKVIRTEDAFDLELPFWICGNCGYAALKHNMGACSNCHDGKLYRARHGGRVDQFVIFKTLNDARMIRDFKTTGWWKKNNKEYFDPDAQIQGYTWAGSKLSGQEFDGALIELVYVTEKKTEVSQFYLTYSRGQQEQWLASVMMERQMIEQMWSRVGELGYLAFPQRTNACADFGGCNFRDACRSGSKYELEKWLKNYTIESHWDFTNPEAEEADL